MYIYLLKLYPSNPDNIYKLGRTNRPFIKRYREYENITTNPFIEMVINCKNSIKAEKDLLALFKKSFILRKDFGNEYFTGNIKKMKYIIMDYFLDENSNDDEIVDKDINEEKNEIKEEMINEIVDDVKKQEQYNKDLEEIDDMRIKIIAEKKDQMKEIDYLIHLIKLKNGLV